VIDVFQTFESLAENTVFLGIHRYFKIQSALMRGVFPVSRLMVLGTTILLAAITVVVFGFLGLSTAHT